jgi:hypothetical protein
MAVVAAGRLICRRARPRGILRAEDAAEGIDSRNRVGGRNENVQQDRINRNQTIDDALGARVVVQFTCPLQNAGLILVMTSVAGNPDAFYPTKFAWSAFKFAGL